MPHLPATGDDRALPRRKHDRAHRAEGEREEIATDGLVGATAMPRSRGRGSGGAGCFAAWVGGPIWASIRCNRSALRSIRA